jgi:hypothetical protein
MDQQVAGIKLQAQQRLLLPELSDQERTLRGTVDKLVCYIRPYSRTQACEHAAAQSHPCLWLHGKPWRAMFFTDRFCHAVCGPNRPWMQVHVERSLESNYTCLRCLSIFTDPVVCVPCGHCCCRACVHDELCPECGAGSNKIQAVIPACNMDKLASKFEFKLNALLHIQRMVEGEIVQV